MLQMVMDILFKGITAIGGFGVVWGLIVIGFALWGSHGQSSGADISPGLLWIVGGAILLAVGITAPGMIDMSWAG